MGFSCLRPLLIVKKGLSTHLSIKSICYPAQNNPEFRQYFPQPVSRFQKMGLLFIQGFLFCTVIAAQVPPELRKKILAYDSFESLMKDMMITLEYPKKKEPAVPRVLAASIFGGINWPKTPNTKFEEEKSSKMADEEKKAALIAEYGSISPGGDNCGVANITVPVPTKYYHPSLVTYPSCYTIQQCAGTCCDRENCCVPTEKVKGNRTIIELVYVGGEEVFLFNGTFSIEVEEHLTCECATCDKVSENSGTSDDIMDDSGEFCLPQKCPICASSTSNNTSPEMTTDMTMAVSAPTTNLISSASTTTSSVTTASDDVTKQITSMKTDSPAVDQINDASTTTTDTTISITSSSSTNANVAGKIQNADRIVATMVSDTSSQVPISTASTSSIDKTISVTPTSTTRTDDVLASADNVRVITTSNTDTSTLQSTRSPTTIAKPTSIASTTDVASTSADDITEATTFDVANTSHENINFIASLTDTNEDDDTDSNFFDKFLKN